MHPEVHMPHLDPSNINWLAVGASGLAVFFLGAIWYTALFGKVWPRVNGYSPEQLAAMQKKRPMPVFLGCMVVCYLVAAMAMAFLMLTAQWSGVHSGIHAGLICFVIVAALRLTGHLATPKLLGAYLIDAGFDFVALLTMGAILGSWR
jgi:hypothetical protein